MIWWNCFECLFGHNKWINIRFDLILLPTTEHKVLIFLCDSISKTTIDFKTEMKMLWIQRNLHLPDQINAAKCIWNFTLFEFNTFIKIKCNISVQNREYMNFIHGMLCIQFNAEAHPFVLEIFDLSEGCTFSQHCIRHYMKQWGEHTHNSLR